MSSMHPLRSTATVLDISRFALHDARNELDHSVATVEAIGDMLEKMQTRIEAQTAEIAEYKREIRDLTMHKEAAYSEMTRAENCARAERDRADRAERLCQQSTATERDMQEKINRLILSVQTTFCRVGQPCSKS